MQPRALIIHATGTNRDHDAAEALRLAGADPEIVHLNLLRRAERRWSDYQLLVVPGGFSYADALGAGKLFALDLQTYFAEAVQAFVAAGKPVIGICNGFQALVKAGILPGAPTPSPSQSLSTNGLYSSQGGEQRATLTFNAAGHFECRWVRLTAPPSNCLWTAGLPEDIECPIAHGEGNFTLSDPAGLEALRQGGQVALLYTAQDGSSLAGGQYPANPNGSLGDVAGICNPEGNVLGLMPHPENHIYPHQYPSWTRGHPGRLGLALFQNGVRAVL